MRILAFIFVILFSVNSAFSQPSDAVTTSGDVLLFAMPVVAFGSTLVFNDKEGSWQFLKGFALNEITTYGLKFVVNKERPDKSNNHSFPSGHTSTTFQSASFLQKRYGWKYGVPAYVLASYTSFTRLQANKHDIVDCLAGAIIGVGSTYLFTTPYQEEHMELSFSSEGDVFLIGCKFKF
ncbi:phosphatase PAP2 family protein [Mariniflexile sp. AS56]|uniref:phosphatase PAP2 family protein n=1 Tax=Mariniflexile sp. AS56 TaxID=3063957 RepID=UPI0026F2FD24|nr:phosphatase PAP2 family protein [Mariniflexile sp. AS56]MDO7170858.1 phosphatase PAP2 family protein [Mariniflexile sp. AS56]